MAKIISKRVAGPDDPIYTGRWVLSPISAPKKSKKKILKRRKKENQRVNSKPIHRTKGI
jgi:hypothetical protein